MLTNNFNGYINYIDQTTDTSSLFFFFKSSVKRKKDIQG